MGTRAFATGTPRLGPVPDQAHQAECSPRQLGAPETINPAKCLTERCQATYRDALKVPSKQRAAGSNPAWRTTARSPVPCSPDLRILFNSNTALVTGAEPCLLDGHSDAVILVSRHYLHDTG